MPNNDIPGRTLRIFQVGHMMETEVVSDLRHSGFLVDEVDPETGEQWEYADFGQHVVCHLDGVISKDGDPEKMVLEIKTMNKARFSAFKRKGVKVSDPKYYDQCQLAMFLSKLETAFFVAICKDNCEYHVEYVSLDAERVAGLISKIAAATALGVKRISSFSKAFGCTMCPKSEACWEKKRDEDAKSCSRCRSSVPVLHGNEKKAWFCTRHERKADAICKDFSWFKPQR